MKAIILFFSSMFMFMLSCVTSGSKVRSDRTPTGVCERNPPYCSMNGDTSKGYLEPVCEDIEFQGDTPKRVKINGQLYYLKPVIKGKCSPDNDPNCRPERDGYHYKEE